MRAGPHVLAFMLLAGLSPVAAQEEPAPALRLSYPEKRWSLTADLEGFVLGEPRLSATGDLVSVSGYDPDSGLILSARLEPARVDGDATVCRQYHWRNLEERTPSARQVEFGELGRIAFVEYLVPMTAGAPGDRKRVHACLVHDGVWINIQLTTGVYKPEDELELARVLWKLRITDGVP
ncbi:MAG: hypothetical protein R3344_04835 [Acidobacteriota bacterium]|nr:hypothetical protein [Acidobacteriota bacterium]